jgi:hypothetical protein
MFEGVRALAQLVLECPYCRTLFEVKPPDNIHSAYSFEKPLRNSYYGKVIRRKLVCQNPACRHRFTLFWYAPFDYFSRM